MHAKFKNTEILNLVVLLFSALTLHIAHLQVLKLLPGYASDFQTRRLVLNPQLASCFCLGYNRLLADFYWLTFLQYYGDFNAAKQRLFYAPSYLRLIVNLDPHFTRPYWFASFVLAGDLGSKEATRILGPIAAQKNRDEASKILDMGIEENPNDWTLAYIAGSSQYLFNNNEEQAAIYYEKAARVKGHPVFLGELIKVMRSKAPTLIKKCQTWGKTYFNTEGPTRDKAKAELQVLWSQVYWHPVTEKYRKNALVNLKLYGVPLLSEKDTPPLDSDSALDMDKRGASSPPPESPEQVVN